MLPENQREYIDRSFEVARDTVFNRLEIMSGLKHISPTTISALTSYLEVALAESDDIIGTRERFAIAQHALDSDERIDLVTKARARRVGNAMICRALEEYRRLSLRDGA